MPFVRIEGVSGKVFIPERSPEPKKHACPDCCECARCSDDRCRVCRERPGQEADTEET